MDVKNQVCTLEQAKKLKELGILQESLCWYVHHLETELVVAFGYSWTDDPGYECYPEKWSAFNVAELGVMLNTFTGNIRKSDNGDYWYAYLDTYQQFKTEVEARAALLICRLEWGSITPDEVNHLLKAA